MRVFALLTLAVLSACDQAPARESARWNIICFPAGVPVVFENVRWEDFSINYHGTRIVAEGQTVREFSPSVQCAAARVEQKGDA